MGKSQEIITNMNNKKYVIISDFNIHSNNRGTAALGYGAIAFLLKNGYIDESYEIVKYSFYRNPFRKHSNDSIEKLDINGKTWKLHTINVWAVEKILLKLKLHFFNTPFRKTVKNVKVVAALNGGDGLTDIYGDVLLNSRLPEMKLAMEFNIPFIVMPQTIGPFLEEMNKAGILNILKKAEKIYVRDDNFVEELKNNGLSYEKTKDLSCYMEPIPFPIEIKKPCVGINVSGLAYSNKFGNLVGQFDAYPKLIAELVKLFRLKGCSVYIIPHSYNVSKPEIFNDDMEASKLFYNSLEDKKGVYFIDKDLISPQIKYAISQMDFFIGTRMHANFAAIFTGTPVFGLAYSYKFKSAFENNGIYNRTADINNIKEEEISIILDNINNAYQEDVLNKE